MNKSIEYKATRGLLKYASQRPSLPGRRTTVSVTPTAACNSTLVMPTALIRPVPVEPAAS